jgi:RNA-directed DNA polymerase
VFTGEIRTDDGKKRQVYLYRAVKTPITRHCKIQGAANPYDPEWEFYFEERLRRRTKESLRGKRQTLRLWLEQEGQCPICDEMITEDDEWDTHHICQRVEGGKDTLDNLILLHLNCHRQVHSRGWTISKPRSVKRTLVEARAGCRETGPSGS